MRMLTACFEIWVRKASCRVFSCRLLTAPQRQLPHSPLTIDPCWGYFQGISLIHHFIQSQSHEDSHTGLCRLLQILLSSPATVFKAIKPKDRTTYVMWEVQGKT